MPPDVSPADAPEASTGHRSLEDVLLESARLHAMRASLLRHQAQRTGLTPPLVVRRLLGGPASHRLRFAALVAARTVRSLVEDGAAVTIGRVRARLGSAPPPARLSRRSQASPADIAADVAFVKRTVGVSLRTPEIDPRKRDPAHDIYRQAIATPAGRRLRHRVLLAAELSIPQCAKYRVWQRKEQFERLGIPCTVVPWWRVPQVLSLLQTHTLLVLYRVPGRSGPLDIIAEANRVGVETVWDVDDLIFDVDFYAANANLRDLPRSLRRELLTGSVAYRTAMLACDRTVGSTAVLSDLMTRASGKPSHMVPNALDAETLAFADAAIASRVRDRGHVVIAYGSGTLTHDTDFAQAAPALLRLLAADPRVRLRIIGTLNLPGGFDDFTDRIDRLETTDFRAYLAALASADISLAPLENTTFNDAKSNIKLIEAASVGLPSVCSPRREFRDAITQGVDGFLADTDDAWFDALQTLARDPALRASVGTRSRERLLAAYAPEQVAATAVRPLAAILSPTERRSMRVLSVNLFFTPRSFGGATIVAEEMAQRLRKRDDTEIFMFTSQNFPSPQYALRRYVARGVDVFGVSMPHTQDEILAFDDPEMGAVFADVLEAVRPDVVHFHAIQHFGAGIVRACQRARIPYVVTVHDAWWLCQRQFMVRDDNTYCYQTTIDLKVCQRCLPNTHHLQSRMDILMQALHGAGRVISPSASHAALYLANGVPADRLVVNRNGVRLPGRPRPARPPGPVRFGYVGGNDPLKGLTLIRRAFASLDRHDWSLALVDNTLNLGFSNFKRADWRLKGEMLIVPAYTQDTMDAFFESIDVLLFPSQWKESFGLTVREALVRDVWVIATDSGAAAEEIVAGVNGDLVPMGNDPAPLARAVASLLADPQRLDGYVNPHKVTVATLEGQAVELHEILQQAVASDDINVL